MAGAIPKELLDLVERPKLDDDGNVVTKTRSERHGRKNVKVERVVTRKILRKEVFDWARRGDRVVVVTTDGRKFSGEIPAKLQKKLDEAAAESGSESDEDKGGDDSKES